MARALKSNSVDLHDNTDLTSFGQNEMANNQFEGILKSFLFL